MDAEKMVRAARQGLYRRLDKERQVRGMLPEIKSVDVLSTDYRQVDFGVVFEGEGTDFYRVTVYHNDVRVVRQ